jgi:frataxin-like iron-binding protein CyaY
MWLLERQFPNQFGNRVKVIETDETQEYLLNATDAELEQWIANESNGMEL